MRAALAICLLLAAGAQAQVPPQLVANMFTGNQLTDEQAKMAEGVWQQTGGMRIDGSVADDELRAAAAAANGTNVDFEAAVEAAISVHNNSAANDFRVFIPYVSRETGAFLGYYLIDLPTAGPTAARLLGFATPMPDGGVMLTANKDEDTGLLQLLVRNATTAVSVLMEGVEVWDEERENVLDNQIVASYTYEKLPQEAVKEALNDLLAIQPAAASHSAGIAAMDRQGHGLGGQGEEGGKGKGSRRLRLA